MLIINFVNAEIIKDGMSYLVSDNDITGTSLEVSSFIVSGIEQSQTFRDDIDGRNRFYAGSEDKYRKIILTVEAKAYDGHDVSHLRDAVNELFSGVYYIREMRLNAVEVAYESPGERSGGLDLGNSQYVNGKQYQVTKVNTVEINDVEDNEFTVELETVDLPYAESIYTTKELNDTGYDATVEKYGLVDGINSDYTQYRFTENTFEVYNAGNVTVRPENMYLEITIGLLTTDGSFELRNLSTGETFEFRKAVTDRNTYIRGMSVYEGSYNGLRDTNRKFVSLKPGVNKFEVTGGTFNEITVDFRYLYK